MKKIQLTQFFRIGLLRFISLFLVIYLRFKGVIIGRQVIIYKKPIVHLWNGGAIYLGDSVLLNSDNQYYHGQMSSPVKLFAEGGLISIGENSRIHGSCIHSESNITIGRNVLIAANTNILDTNGHEISMGKPQERLNKRDLPVPIKIEDDVWICMNCTILKGVTIGRGSIIGANSVVASDIPPGVIARGNPAQTI